MNKTLKLFLAIFLTIVFVITSFGFSSIPVKSIKLNSANVSLQVGKTYQLKISYTPANTTQKTLKYLTGNKNIASVDNKGLIKAIGVGKTVITVASASNSKVIAKCNVSIVKPVSTKTTNLIYYYGGIPNSDQDQVFAEANKIIKNEINAIVKFKPLGLGEYAQKTSLIVAAGEPYDLHQSGGFRQPYVSNSIKGAYKELDTLLPKYGSWFKENIPQNVMDGMKVKGKTYAVPNYQIVSQQPGMIFLKELVDKYKFDVKNVKNVEDLIPIYETIKKNEPDMICTVGPINDYLTFGGLENYDEPYTGLGVYLDSSLKVFDVIKNPAFLRAVNFNRLCYEKGYYPKDIATIANQYNVWKTGKVFSGYYGYKPGGEASAKDLMGGKDVVYIPTSNAVVSNYMITATITAISSASKNPEKAMMFLNLLNSNKVLNNILFFGIEGKHYKKVAESRIELIGKPVYQSYQWCIGTQFNAYLLPGQADNVWEQTRKMNAEAKKAPSLGFTFDPKYVMSEIAAIQNIAKEEGAILGYGLSEDVQGTIKKYSDKRYAVGLQKVMDEMQKQIDEWKKTR